MRCKIGIIIGVASISLLAAGCSKIIVTQNTTQTEPPTIYNTIGLNSAAAKSANGLSFSVSTDLPSYAPGQEIEVVTDEKNTLAKTNNIPIADNWPLNGLTRMGFGNPNPNIPYGIAVYQGDYTSANFSAATPLNLDNPTAIYLGPPYFAPTSFSFHPLSDIADIIPGKNIPSADAGSNTTNQQISAEITLKGYWTNSSVPNFTYFDPGVYTVVGGDEWGNLVFVHFTISNAVATTTPAVNSENAPVKVISISNPHLNPPTDSPTVELNLENVSTEPIVSLSAVLIEFAPQDYNFSLNVTPANPLLPGTNVIGFSDLFQGAFGDGIAYSLKISGTYQNGKTFTFAWEPPSN
jgi:hypothetical protein